MKALHEIDSAQAAILFGLFIGLGIGHAFFLLAAIPIAVKVMQAIHQHHEQTRPAYRAR